MDNIKVGIRVRPLLPREKESGSQWVSSGNSISQRGTSSATPYYFDHVFEGDIPTMDVYEILAKPIVLSVMEGFNGTIFAYGQTSSGKTHTMMGDEESYGIIPHSIGEVFHFIEKSPEREFLIRASYLEIYNETLTDLLDPFNKHVKIRENSERNVIVHGLTEHPVVDVGDVGMIIRQGEEYRSVGETQMNDRSSRSHTIFTLTVESRLRGEEVEDKAVKVAALNLVDLAGSERPSATGAEGIRFTEGTFINKSLLVLGNVISKLSEGNSSHIPFRDSKLTRILQTSLGGNAKTCIICTVTPAEMLETHSTLKFASRAKNIKNKPVVNEIVVGEEALKKKLKKYERENEQLKKKLEEGLSAQERQQLTELIDQKEKQRCDIEARMKALEEIIVKSSSGEGRQANERSEVHQISRRRTICPGHLSRDLPHFSPLPLTASKLYVAPIATNSPAGPLGRPFLKNTPAGNRRVTFAPSPSFVSPFIVKFDCESFDKHLNDVKSSEHEEIPTPELVVDRRKRLKSRLSFLPPVSSTPGNSYWEDSLESSTASAGSGVVTCDVQVQTSPLKDSLSLGITSETHKQTDAQAPPTPCVHPVRSIISSPVDMLHRSCSKSGGLNSSLCMHKTESMRAVERMETMQFEVDENSVRIEELERLLQESERASSLSKTSSRKGQEEIERMKTKTKDLEMASEAQEELLLSLQGRLKQANNKIHQVEELNQGLQRQLSETETTTAASPPPVSSEGEHKTLKHELETLKSQLADSTSRSEHVVKLNEAIAEHREKEDTLVSQLRDLTSQLQMMTSNRDQLSTVNDSLFKQVTVTEEQVLQLTTRLEESETQTKAMEGFCAELNDANTQLQVMESLRTELEKTKEQLLVTESLRSKLQEAKGQLSAMESLRSELQEAKDQLSAMDSLRAELQEAKDQLSAMDSLRAELQEAKDQLSAMDSLRAELQEAKDQLSVMDSLRAELQEVKEELQTREGLQLNGARIVELTSEVAELRSQLEVMDSLQLELAEAKREIELNIHEENTPVSLSSELSEARVTELSGELQESLKTINALQLELSEARRETELCKDEWEEKMARVCCELTEARKEVVLLNKQLVEESMRTESGVSAKSELEIVRGELGSVRGHVQEREEVIDKQSGEIEALKEQMKLEALKMEKDRDQFACESQQLAQQVNDLKAQLLLWQRKIEDSPPVTATKNDNSHEVELLTAKLTEMEKCRREEAQDFQRIYRLKVDETNKACERVCQLEEELEGLRESEIQVQFTQRDRCSELEELLRGRENTIQKLNEKCSTAQDEAHRMWTDHEEKLAKAEATVRDLQHQLTAMTEKQSSQDGECEELRSSLAEARERLEDGERQLKKAVKERNEAMWNEDQVETKCSLLENEVEDLTEVLKRKKALVEHLEREIETLKRDTQESVHTLQEKVVGSDTVTEELKKQLSSMTEKLSSQDGVCEELRSSLAEARERLEDGERQLKKAVNDRNEAMWNEDQVETKCSLLENEVEDLTEELKKKKSLIEKLESEIETMKQYIQERMRKIASPDTAAEELKKRLAVMTEKLFSQDGECEVLRSSLAEARERLEDGERQLKKAVNERNEAMWNEDQVETKCSLLENDVEDLTEELKQKKAFIEQLEREIKTMEQDTQVQCKEKDSDSTIKELHQRLALMTDKLSSQDGECEVLRTSLAEARERLEDGERQLKKAVKERNEAMWNEDQVETRCSLLENDVENLTEVLKANKATIAELESTIKTLKLETQQEGEVNFTVDLEALSDEERKALIVKLQQDLEYMTRKCAVLDEFLTEKEDLLSSSNEKLTETRSECTKSMSEMNSKLESLKEENKKLRLRVQGLACIPAPPTEPVVDGSGTITGLAYYLIEQELRVTKSECDELKEKYQRLKTEFKEKLVHGHDIEDMKRYREQRNIFMTKYDQMKKVCTCGAKEKIRRDATSAADSSSSSTHKSDTSSHESVKPLPPPPVNSADPLPSHPHKVPHPSKTAPAVPPSSTVPLGPSSYKLPSTKPHNYLTTSATLVSSHYMTNPSSKVASAFSTVSHSKLQPSSYTSAAVQCTAPAEKKSLFSYRFPPATDCSTTNVPANNETLQPSKHQPVTTHCNTSLWSTTSPPKKQPSQTLMFNQDKKTQPAASTAPVSLAEKKSIFSSNFPSSTDHPTSAVASNDETLKPSKYQPATTQRSTSLWSTTSPPMKEPSQPHSFTQDKPAVSTAPVSGPGLTEENMNPATAFLEDGLEQRCEVKKRKFFWEDSILDSTQACIEKHEDPMSNNDCKTQ